MTLVVEPDYSSIAEENLEELRKDIPDRNVELKRISVSIE